MTPEDIRDIYNRIKAAIPPNTDDLVVVLALSKIIEERADHVAWDEKLGGNKH